jgi:hypothetical protein
VSDRTIITRLRRERAALRSKLAEAQAELKWRRKFGTTAMQAHYDKMRAEQNAVRAGFKKLFAKQARLRKVDALAADARGNANERANAQAMADKIRGRA